MSDLLLPATILKNDYQLAYKYFVNKNFEASYELVKKLYRQALRNLAADAIPEALFIRIIKLYLTEVGLFVNSNKHALPKTERLHIEGEIRDEVLLNDLLGLYDEVNSIPTELLLSLVLVAYSLDIGFAYEQLKRLYLVIDWVQDPNLKKILEIYVFQVLSRLDRLDEARQIIQHNELLSETDLDRLNKAIETQRQEEELRKKKIAEKQAQEKQREREAARQREEKHNLKYRSIKQLKEELSPKSTTKEEVTETTVSKLKYLLSLSQKYIVDNSPVLVAVLVALIVLSRFVKVSRGDLVAKARETIQMAFKISYL